MIISVFIFLLLHATIPSLGHISLAVGYPNCSIIKHGLNNREIIIKGTLTCGSAWKGCGALFERPVYSTQWQLRDKCSIEFVIGNNVRLVCYCRENSTYELHDILTVLLENGPSPTLSPSTPIESPSVSIPVHSMPEPEPMATELRNAVVIFLIVGCCALCNIIWVLFVTYSGCCKIHSSDYDIISKYL